MRAFLVSVALLALIGCASNRALLQPQKLNGKAPETFHVEFETTRGPFTIEVTRAWSPIGADRFYQLVRHHFYDGAAFFRVLPGFVAQFGINPDPMITKAWEHTEIKDDPVKQTNARGTVAFATDGPETRTTQVFVNLGENQRLDARGFSPFGRVTKGMDVVERFYSGYGEGLPKGSGPDQKRIESEGELYLHTEYPKLDYIYTTKLRR